MPFLSIALPNWHDRNSDCGYVTQRRRVAVLHQRRTRPVRALRSVMPMRSPMSRSRVRGHA